jgi:hypothetical protein
MPKGKVINIADAKKRAAEIEGRPAIVDEFGDLHRELAAVEAKSKRFDALKKLIASWPVADKVDPALGKLYEGARWAAEVTAAENKSKVDVAGVYDALGKAEFLQIAKPPTIEDLKKHLNPVQFGALVAYSRTGSRHVKPLERAAPVAAPAKKKAA